MTPILVSRDAGVLSLTLNRPDKLNAFNPEMHRLLREALEEARDEPGVRAVLLTGSGRGFCAGQDLSERNVGADAAPIDLSVSLGNRRLAADHIEELVSRAADVRRAGEARAAHRPADVH